MCMMNHSVHTISTVPAKIYSAASAISRANHWFARTHPNFDRDETIRLDINLTEEFIGNVCDG